MAYIDSDLGCLADDKREAAARAMLAALEAVCSADSHAAAMPDYARHSDFVPLRRAIAATRAVIAQARAAGIAD